MMACLIFLFFSLLVNLDSSESARIVLILMTFWAGSTAVSWSSICWMAYLTMAPQQSNYSYCARVLHGKYNILWYPSYLDLLSRVAVFLPKFSFDFVFVPAAKLVASLVYALGRSIFLLIRLLRCDSIVIPECVAFRGREDLCQSLDGSDSQLAGFVGLLVQVVQVVRVLLDCLVRNVLLGEDISKLLEAADRTGWQGIEPGSTFSAALPRQHVGGLRLRGIFCSLVTRIGSSGARQSVFLHCPHCEGYLVDLPKGLAFHERFPACPGRRRC
ncbi:unnamed protein product [Prunus armeniaca]